MKPTAKNKKSQIPGNWPGSWPEGKTSKKLAWLYLLQLARHNEIFKWKGKWQYSVIPGQEGKKVKIPFIIKYGSVGIVKSQLAKKWNWSRPKVQRFFKELVKSGRITEVLYEGIGTIITIVNMEKENTPSLWK